MAVERPRAGFGFWFWWLVVGILGFAVVEAIRGAVIGSMGESVTEEIDPAVFGAVGGIVIGLIVGFLQWLVLRGSLTRAGVWVVACIVGFALAGGAARPVEVALRDAFQQGGSAIVVGAVVGVVVGAVVGAIAGIVQWLVLAPQVSRAGWWIVASIVGAALGGAVGLAAGEPIVAAIGGVPADPALGMATVGAVTGAILGIVYALITGSWLLGLLRQPIRLA